MMTKLGWLDGLGPIDINRGGLKRGATSGGVTSVLLDQSVASKAILVVFVVPMDADPSISVSFFARMIPGDMTGDHIPVQAYNARAVILPATPRTSSR